MEQPFSQQDALTAAAVTCPVEHVESQTGLEVWSLSELPTIGILPRERMVFSPSLKIRQQLYQLDHSSLSKFSIRRTEGMIGAISLKDFIVIEAADSNRENFKIAVHPEWIWNITGQFITPELATWSDSHAPEIVEIINYSLMDVLDFFDWSLQRISKLNLANLTSPDNALYFCDQSGTKLVAFGCRESLDLAELSIRTYSVEYRKNCLWLGQAMLFNLHLLLKLQKTIWLPHEIKGIALGDLLCLQQFIPESGSVDIRARVVSHAACSVQWSREVYFRMTDDDSKIRMGDEAWANSRDTNDDTGYSPHQYGFDHSRPPHKHDNDDENLSLRGHRVVEGMSGPEDVTLEVIAGVTQVNFNELCNIQEGSLIELQTHTLPMVRLAVGGVPILEGELVRFKDMVMVQVTQRIDHGSGNN